MNTDHKNHYFTGSNISHWYHNTSEFATPLINSYKCTKIQTFNLTDVKNVTAAYLHVSQLQLQAFRNATGHVFASGKVIIE